MNYVGVALSVHAPGPHAGGTLLSSCAFCSMACAAPLFSNTVIHFFRRRSFGSVLDIIPLADSVTKLTARCELCGKRAFFTLRKTEETQTELIGGADVYMPVCRQHYVNGQVIIEAARSVLEPQRVQCDPYVKAAPLSN